MNSIAFIDNIFCSGSKTRGELMELEGLVNGLTPAFMDSVQQDVCGGVYTRKAFIPKGSFIVGAIHKNEYVINIHAGKVLLVSEFYSVELIGPCTFNVPAGVKHVGLHLEDTYWTDTHSVKASTPEAASEEIFASSYEALDIHNNIIDFDRACEDLGVTKEFVRKVSEIKEDIVPQPPHDSVCVSRSPIEGLGMFTTASFKAGDNVALVRFGVLRTEAGRYTNHALAPNCVPVVTGDAIHLVAITDILTNVEITVDYRASREISKCLDS